MLPHEAAFKRTPSSYKEHLFCHCAHANFSHVQVRHVETLQKIDHCVDADIEETFWKRSENVENNY